MPIENHTGNTSTPCKSAHNTDSTFSSVSNIDDMSIQYIITHQAEWEGEYSTASQSSDHTKYISIDESDNSGIQGHRYFENRTLSTSSQQSDQKYNA